MRGKYIILLFKNKVRYKIIKNYQTYKKSLDFFNKKLKESENVVFEVQTEAGQPVEYELALISTDNSKNIKLFKQDELGRNIQVETDDNNFVIMDIKKYKVVEKLFDIRANKKIESNALIEKILRGKSLKMVSKLNNKVIVQEDNDFELYSLKNEYDSLRFLNNLESHMINLGKKNCLIVKDSSSQQKKYMYEILSNLGYDKKMLYRKHTTYSKDI